MLRQEPRAEWEAEMWRGTMKVERLQEICWRVVRSVVTVLVAASWWWSSWVLSRAGLPPCSFPPEDISWVCILCTGYDVSCQWHTAHSPHSCSHILFLVWWSVWRSQHIHHRQRCHNAFLNWSLHTLCKARHTRCDCCCCWYWGHLICPWWWFQWYW